MQGAVHALELMLEPCVRLLPSMRRRILVPPQSSQATDMHVTALAPAALRVQTTNSDFNLNLHLSPQSGKYNRMLRSRTEGLRISLAAHSAAGIYAML